MAATLAHRKLAEKFVFKSQYPNTFTADSLVALVEFLFTEEEATIVEALSFTPVPARIVARRLKRPVKEVSPILSSLAERLLIIGLSAKGLPLYGFAMLVPGIFEFQMIQSRNKGTDTGYYTRLSELFEDVYEEFVEWSRPQVAGRELRFSRVIAVEKSIESSPGIMPLATDRYSEIVDRNRSFCLVNVCACRQGQTLLGKGCNKGMDVCSGMGVAADLAISKGIARRVSKEEFIEAKARAADLGLVNIVDNLNDPLQVCSCCSCCCGALRTLRSYRTPTIVVGSHFEAVVDEEKCSACKKCADVCPMDAITVKVKEEATVDYTRCIGCGLCVLKCEKEKAITLRTRPHHKPPNDNLFDYIADRKREIEGPSLIPDLRFGVASVLTSVAPFNVSGPKYRPMVRK